MAFRCCASNEARFARALRAVNAWIVSNSDPIDRVTRGTAACVSIIPHLASRAFELGLSAESVCRRVPAAKIEWVRECFENSMQVLT